MSEKKIFKLTYVLIIISLISKIFGFIRDLLIAKSFGAGMETDIYFIALITSTILFGVVSLALSTTLIPMISKVIKKEGVKKEIQYVNNINNILFFFTILVVIIGYLFAPLLVNLIASGFTGEKFELAVKLTRIGLPVIMFNSFFAVFKGYLHVHRKFMIPALEGLAISIPIILYLLFFSKEFGIIGLMVVTTFAGLFKLLLIIPSTLKTGFSFIPRVDLQDKYFKMILFILGPIVLGSMSGYINTIVDRSIASQLIEGSISSLSYAARIRQLVLGLFITTIITVLYPMIAKIASENKSSQSIIKFGINIITLISIPATTVIMILNYPLTKLIFQRGAFTLSDTIMTSSALFYYSIGIIGVGVTGLLSKVFFAMHDTKTPVIISVVAVVINIILNLILTPFMGHNGLALGTSIAAIFSAVALMVFLKKNNKEIVISKYLIVLIKSITASIVMGLLIYILNEYYINLIDGSFVFRSIKLFIIAAAGVIVYCLLIYIFKVKEFKLGLELVKAKIQNVIPVNIDREKN